MPKVANSTPLQQRQLAVIPERDVRRDVHVGPTLAANNPISPDHVCRALHSPIYEEVGRTVVQMVAPLLREGECVPGKLATGATALELELSQVLEEIQQLRKQLQHLPVAKGVWPQRGSAPGHFPKDLTGNRVERSAGPLCPGLGAPASPLGVSDGTIPMYGARLSQSKRASGSVGPSSVALTSMTFSLSKGTATQVESSRNIGQACAKALASISSTTDMETTAAAPTIVTNSSQRTVASTALDVRSEHKKKFLGIFAQLDEDANGRIQTEELRHALREVGESPARARKLLGEIDRDGDGAIDRQEWELAVNRFFSGKGESDALAIVNALMQRPEGERHTATNFGMAPAQVRNRCLIGYRSNFRLTWDLYLAALLIYTAVMTPYEISFASASTIRVLGVCGFVFDIFFILDVVLNFRTTYVNGKGVHIVSGKQIAHHYLRTWFLPDVIAAIPYDFIVKTAVPEAEAAKLSEVAKLIKLFKMWRLLKIARILFVSHIMDVIHDLMVVSGSPTPAYIFGIICSALVVCHWLACFMVLVDGKSGMLDTYLDGDFMEGNPSELAQYVVAQYWAVMTMTTVGYGDITPSSNGGRLFCILAMGLGGGFYSYVIGYVAVVVGNRNLNDQAYQHRLREVKAWLDHYAFTSNMRHRIWRYFKSSLRHKAVHESFSIINDLSPELRHAVTLIIVPQEVRNNPLFHDVPSIVLTCLASIIRNVSAEEAEPIASYGDYGYGMCILLKGTAIISRNGATATTRDEALLILTSHLNSQVLLPSDSFGEEFVLCLEREYAYSVVAASNLHMAVVPSDDFATQVAGMPDVLKKMRMNHAVE